MRIRPLMWFLGLVGTLAALSIAVGSGRIIHAQVYGSPPAPPNATVTPVATVPPIATEAITPVPPTTTPVPPGITPTGVPPLGVQTPPATPPPATGTPTIVIPVSGLPKTGVMSKVTTLVEQPLFELIVGVGILSALGIFFVWNARSARPASAAVPAERLAERLATSVAAASTAAPRPQASAPRTAGQPLPPLTARLRPLGALRDRADG